MDYTEYLKFFIGLFAIINPCGMLPVFIDFTDNMSKAERLKLNLVTNITVIIILFGALFLGTSILSWFGISLSSFRIAGSILIAMMAYSMLKGNLKGDVGKDSDSAVAYAIVPLALPLLAGPGAISSIIAYSVDYPTLSSKLELILAILTFFVSSVLIFQLADFIFKCLHHIGISVVTRIMGLVMMALAVEIFVVGLKEEFPMLGGQ